MNVLGCDISTGDAQSRAVDHLSQSGQVQAYFVSSALHKSQTGIHADAWSATVGGSVNVFVRNCTIWENGDGSASAGGIFVPSSACGRVTFERRSDVVHSNIWSQDTPRFGVAPAGTFTFSCCYVQQGGDLAASPHINGNLPGNAVYFADAANGDFHLPKAPGSVMPTAVMYTGLLPSWYYQGYVEDIDGYGAQRTAYQGLDIGADEHEEHFVYSHGAPTLGQATHVTLIGNGAAPEAYALFPDAGQLQPIFAPGTLLLNPSTTFLFSSGAIPANHVGTVGFTVPMDPSILGYPVNLQAVFVDNTTNPIGVYWSNLAVEPIHRWRRIGDFGRAAPESS